jgi:hypothetical protein
MKIYHFNLENTMSRIPNIFRNGKRTEKDGEITISIPDFPNFPTTDKKIDYLFILMSLQSIILETQGVILPTFVKMWFSDITPNHYNLENNKFSLDGIREKINYFSDELSYGKSFMKTQVIYEDGEELPTIRIHFFNFNEKEGGKVSNESFLYPFTFFVYDEDLFSEERIRKMEDNGINFGFLEILPIMNLCPIEFDENGELKTLKELERYKDNWK